MKKGGQVAVFIIVAILLIAIVFLILYLKGVSIKSLFDKKTTEQIAFENEASKIHSLIEECLTQTTLESARLVGLQGGYVLPKSFVKLADVPVSYGQYKGSSSLPSLNRISEEMAYYNDIMFPYCMEYYPLDNIEIAFEDIYSKVEIKQGIIQNSAKVNLILSRASSSMSINKKYESQIPINLYDMHKLAQDIIEKEIKNPDSIDITYLASQDYKISVIPSDNNLIYSIIDENLKNPDYFYTFRFASRK